MHLRAFLKRIASPGPQLKAGRLALTGGLYYTQGISGACRCSWLDSLLTNEPRLPSPIKARIMMHNISNFDTFKGLILLH